MFKKNLFIELGKNTGKWASNKLFGDNWSTPYRFYNSGTSIANYKVLVFWSHCYNKPKHLWLSFITELDQSCGIG